MARAWEVKNDRDQRSGSGRRKDGQHPNSPIELRQVVLVSHTQNTKAKGRERQGTLAAFVQSGSEQERCRIPESYWSLKIERTTFFSLEGHFGRRKFSIQ